MVAFRLLPPEMHTSLTQAEGDSLVTLAKAKPATDVDLRFSILAFLQFERKCREARCESGNQALVTRIRLLDPIKRVRAAHVLAVPHEDAIE